MRDVEALLRELSGEPHASFSLDDVKAKGLAHRRQLRRRFAASCACVAMLVLGGVIAIGPPKADTTEIVYAGSDRGADVVSSGPTIGKEDSAVLDNERLGATPTKQAASTAVGDGKPPSGPTPTEVAESDGTPAAIRGAGPTATSADSLTPTATPSPGPATAITPTATPSPGPATAITPTAVPSPTTTATQVAPPTSTATPPPTPTDLPPPTATTTTTPAPTATSSPTPTEVPSPTPTLTPTPSPTVQVLGDCAAGATPLSGSVLQSGQFDANHPGSQAFDGLGTPWLSEVWIDPAYIGLALGSEPAEVHAYSIFFTNAGLETRAPNTWNLEGSHDGSQWTVIDNRAGQSNWVANELRSFNVASPGPFTHYRLIVFEDNDDRAPIVVVSISELALHTDCLY